MNTLSFILFFCVFRRKKNHILFFCMLFVSMLTGAVGLPLPDVEVRIVMNNTTNTVIAEGNHKETQVNQYESL